MNINSVERNSINTQTAIFVAEQVRTIDQLIETNSANNRTAIEHFLPTQLTIANLTLKDSQIMLYSELVRVYKNPIAQGGKGFTDTFITLGPPPKLIIRWRVGLSDQEREDRLSILRSVEIPK